MHDYGHNIAHSYKYFYFQQMLPHRGPAGYGLERLEQMINNNRGGHRVAAGHRGRAGHHRVMDGDRLAGRVYR